MYEFITVLIIIVCVLIILAVLVQNPKGGGLGASFGGVSSNFMGVQRTTDFLEKTTWTLAIALLALSLISSFFIERGETQQASDPALDDLKPVTENPPPGFEVVPEGAEATPIQPVEGGQPAAQPAQPAEGQPVQPIEAE